MEDQIILDIKSLISKEIERQSYSLTRGGASSYEEYKYKIGGIKAYNHALEIIDSVIKGYVDNN